MGFQILKSHLTFGKHVFRSTAIILLDKAKLFYKQFIENNTNRISITLNQFNNVKSTISNIRRLQDWALVKEKKTTNILEC